MVKKFLTFIDLKIQYSVTRSRLLSLQPIQSSARFYILFNTIHTKQAEVAVTLHTCIRKECPARIQAEKLTRTENCRTFLQSLHVNTELLLLRPRLLALKSFTTDDSSSHLPHTLQFDT
jgi:hypothetical protein